MKYFLSALSMLAMLLSASPALAIGPSDKAAQNPPAGVAEARCEDRKGRVSGRIEAGDKVQSKHDQVMANVIERINKIIDVAEASDIDTTKLSSDLKTLEGYRATLKADHEAVITQLRSMTSAACSDSVEEWKADVTEFHTLVEKVHANAKVIKDFYLNTLKVDLLAVAAEIKAAKVAGEPEDESEVEDADEAENEEAEND